MQPGPTRLVARRVRDLLRAEIRSGVYADRRLPAEFELMAQHQASRDAVREALDLLRRDGLIERRRGVGTTATHDEFVGSPRLPPGGSSLEAWLAIGRITPRLLHWNRIGAPGAIAAHLDGVGVGDDCLCVEYVLLVDGRPTAVFTNYLRAAEASKIDEHRFETDFYTLLRSGGVAIAASDLSVQAAAADECTAELLEVTAGDPVMLWEQTIRDPAGEAVDYALGALHRDFVVTFGELPCPDLTGSLVSQAAG